MWAGPARSLPRGLHAKERKHMDGREARMEWTDGGFCFNFWVGIYDDYDGMMFFFGDFLEISDLCWLDFFGIYASDWDIFFGISNTLMGMTVFSWTCFLLSAFSHDWVVDFRVPSFQTNAGATMDGSPPVNASNYDDTIYA